MRYQPQENEGPNADIRLAATLGVAMSARLALPARLDSTAAGSLTGDILDLAGAPLDLDAAEVTHIGTPGLQVLLAAARSWREANIPLSFSNAAPAVGKQLSALGLSAADLSHQPDKE